MQPRTIFSVATKQPIPYSFKLLTFRQFNAAVDKMDDARSLGRKERNQLTEEALCELIENAKQLMDEASNADVQQATVDAIDFNQVGDTEAKKSE
jgi:hypothetical protein